MTATRNTSTDAIGSLPAIRRRGFVKTMFPVLIKGLFERGLYRIATIGFDNLVLMFMTLLLVGSAISLGGQVRLFQATVILPVVIMLFAIAMRIKRDPENWREGSMYMLRDWVPFVLVVFLYENLAAVAGQVMPFDIAGVMREWDLVILGVEPTIWAQKIYSPLLTDIMSLSYALYLAEPLFLMFLLSLWGKRAEFRHMALTLTFTFLLGFTGYVFLPCSPPRYFIEHLYTDPIRLQGLFFFDRLQGAWDGLSVVSGGAFPSLHVGISAVALIYAFKFRNMNKTCRIVWYAYVPMVTSLWFSTVYLRHHWVIDIFAGWFVTGVAYLVSCALMKVWRRLRMRYDLPF